MTVSVDSLRETIANYGIRLGHDPRLRHQGTADLMGSYDSRTRTIRIARGLSTGQQVVTLQHELIHALHDQNGTWDPDPQVEEMRTRTETALRLVSPYEYAIAERLYGPDPWCLADQLGLTVHVVRDWQQLAHDNPRLLRTAEKAF